MKGKRKISRRLFGKIALGILVLAVAGSGVGYALTKVSGAAQTTEPMIMEGTVQFGNLDMTVSASGTTAGTTDYQICTWSSSFPDLVVESVSATAGETVKKGDILYTLTKESVDKVSSSLERDFVLYQAELKAARMDYEEAVNEAKTEYETNLSLASTASLDYQDTLAYYEQKAAETKKQLENAQKVIKDYPKEISTAQKELEKEKNQKKTLKKSIVTQDVKLEEAEKEVQRLQKEYESAQSEYNNLDIVAKYLEKYQGEDKTALTELEETVTSQLEEQKKAVQQAKAVYDAANEVYEKQKKKSDSLSAKLMNKEESIQTLSEDISSKEKELSEVKGNLTRYRSEYLKAVSEQSVEKVTARQTYEESMNTYQNAKSIYEKALKTAESNLETAKQNLTSVKNQKKTFFALVHGQQIWADRDGVIESVSYQIGNCLNKNTPVAGYQDSGVMNIEVSLDQTDIAAVKVGDKVNVTLPSMRGTMEGTVSVIETDTSSERVSSVSYTVIVTVENQDGNISADETATVSFSKGTLENVLYMPVTAVNTSSGQSTVVIRNEDGTTKKVQVSVGENNGQFIVIESGLKEGDTYVVEMES